MSVCLPQRLTPHHVTSVLGEFFRNPTPMVGLFLALRAGLNDRLTTAFYRRRVTSWWGSSRTMMSPARRRGVAHHGVAGSAALRAIVGIRGMLGVAASPRQHFQSLILDLIAADFAPAVIAGVKASKRVVKPCRLALQSLDERCVLVLCLQQLRRVDRVADVTICRLRCLCFAAEPSKLLSHVLSSGGNNSSCLGVVHGDQCSVILIADPSETGQSSRRRTPSMLRPILGHLISRRREGPA
jgi:hypothetical protein